MWLTLLIAAALFFAGLKMSFFFSGTEFGFYRVSFLRLSIDAHSGDRTARRLLWFVQHPEWFVSTALVGNNIANYVVTIALGLLTSVFITTSSAWVEVASTLLFTPVLFLFGELMPKSLYLRAPMLLLRRGLRWFRLCYHLLLPVTWPLVGITHLLEKLSKARPHELDLVLGRHRLIHVLNKGHEHGLLTAGQGQLLHGLLHDASRPAIEIMIPVTRVLGMQEDAERSALLAFAKDYGLTHIPLRRKGTDNGWFASIRVIDLELSSRPVNALMRPMPRLGKDATRLTALLALRDTAHSIGAICEGDRVLGLVSERALVEHFMNPTGSRKAARVPRPVPASP